MTGPAGIRTLAASCLMLAGQGPPAAAAEPGGGREADGLRLLFTGQTNNQDDFGPAWFPLPGPSAGVRE